MLSLSGGNLKNKEGGNFMAQEITVDDLLKKIGYLTVQLDAANAKIELLASEIEKERSTEDKKEINKNSKSE